MAIGEREEKSDLGEDVYRVGSYLHTTAKLLLSSVDKEMAIWYTNSNCQIVNLFFLAKFTHYLVE